MKKETEVWRMLPTRQFQVGSDYPKWLNQGRMAPRPKYKVYWTHRCRWNLGHRTLLHTIEQNIHIYGDHLWPRVKNEPHWHRAAKRMFDRYPKFSFQSRMDVC